MSNNNTKKRMPKNIFQVGQISNINDVIINVEMDQNANCFDLLAKLNP